VGKFVPEVTVVCGFVELVDKNDNGFVSVEVDVGAAVVVAVVAVDDPNKPAPKLADLATCGSVLVDSPPSKDVETGKVEVAGAVL
jgi:hypothetical protein